MNAESQVVDSNQRAAMRANNRATHLATTGTHHMEQLTGERVARVSPKEQSKKRKKKKKIAQVTMDLTGNDLLNVPQLLKLMHPDLRDYLHTLADPWRDMRVFCPVNYNPVPSFVTQYARTTCQLISKTIAASTATNLILFPGHSTLAVQQAANFAGSLTMDVSDFDEVAYHEPVNTFSGSNRVVGPVPTISVAGNTLTPTIGGWVDGLAIGSVAASTAVMQPLVYDQVLPYTIDVRSPGHGRWKLTSMGLKVINVTPVQARGGSIISYQPINNTPQAAGTITQYARLPTYKDWGPSRADITWIPRMRDCAFWHLSTQQLVATGNDAGYTNVVPGISVCITAPAGATGQTYDIVAVCNWELAGDLFASVGSKGTHRPELKSVVERVHSELVNTRPTAKEAVSVGVQAFHAVRQGLGVAARVGAAVSTAVGAIAK